MNISIDFDDTFTADPELWAAFIKLAQFREHKVVCITARYFTQENLNELTNTFIEHELDIPIHFSNHGSKKNYALAHDLDINLWIDDCPEAIVIGII